MKLFATIFVVLASVRSLYAASAEGVLVANMYNEWSSCFGKAHPIVTSWGALSGPSESDSFKTVWAKANLRIFANHGCTGQGTFVKNDDCISFSGKETIACIRIA